MKLVKVTMMGVLAVAGVQADQITHGGVTVNMDFVNMGHAGFRGDAANVLHGVDAGSVDYNYRIGQFEVTAAQWASVVAADSRVGSNIGMATGNRPAVLVEWEGAAKFANWLTTGDAYSGAYQFNDSGTLISVMSRTQMQADGGTFYVLPTEHEWYKAAYLKSDASAYTRYTTGDAVPLMGSLGLNYGNPLMNDGAWDVGSGIVENNGTYDMNGNVWEWNESAIDGTLDELGQEELVVRGGAFGSAEGHLRSSERLAFLPTGVHANVGFRLAAIPEPSSLFLLGGVGVCGLFLRRVMS